MQLTQPQRPLMHLDPYQHDIIIICIVKTRRASCFTFLFVFIFFYLSFQIILILTVTSDGLLSAHSDPLHTFAENNAIHGILDSFAPHKCRKHTQICSVVHRGPSYTWTATEVEIASNETRVTCLICGFF